MLLTDVRLVENLQVISESTGPGKPMKVRGIFQRADEANNNGRIYPQQVLENAINNLIEAVQERRCVGELDHPTYDMVKLSNASHIITSLRFEGKDVIGEAEILSTPAGKVVEALIRDGIKIGISSRGMGTLSEGKGHKIVNEDFKLLTFDIVADPSTRGAFPTLAESRNYNSKLVENTIKKVVGRNVFLSMLEAKIDNKLDELRVDEKRCWKGYEPTPGVEPYAKGSCRLKRKKRRDEATVLETKADKKLPEGEVEGEMVNYRGEPVIINHPKKLSGPRGEARIDRRVAELAKGDPAEEAYWDPIVRRDRLRDHLRRRGVKKSTVEEANLLDKDKSIGEKAKQRDARDKVAQGLASVSIPKRTTRQTRKELHKEKGKVARDLKSMGTSLKRAMRNDSSNVYEKYGNHFLIEMIKGKPYSISDSPYVIQEKPKKVKLPPKIQLPKKEKPTEAPKPKSGKY